MRVPLTNQVCTQAKAKHAQYFLWDTRLENFGLRVTPNAVKSFVVQYRLGYGRKARSRRMTIGRFGSSHWTIDSARKKARSILSRVAEGYDPLESAIAQSNALSISDLGDLYFAEGCDHKKPLTIKYDHSRFHGHIRPFIGRKKVDELTRRDVELLMRSIANGKTANRGNPELPKCVGGKSAATRTVGLLQGMLSFAVERGLVDRNVAKGIKRYPDKKRERFLSRAELEQLGISLDCHRARNVNSMGLDIIELLILTGARRGEITSLKWEMIDFENASITLPDSKTGKRSFPINAAAETILRRQKRWSTWVFPAARGDGHYQGLGKIWRKVRAQARLDDVRIHDLRHTFASFGASHGQSLFLVGKLLGHSQPSTTARYAHCFDDPVRESSAIISDSISMLMRPSVSLNEGT